MSKKLSFTILIILIIIAGIFLITKTEKTQEKSPQTHEEKIQEKLEQANIKRIKGETHNTYINQETGYETKLPKGEFDFKTMGGGDKLPGFVSGNIDPVEVVPGDVQTMTVTIKDDVPLKRVWAEIETDTGKDTVEMKLIESGPLTFEDLNTYPYSISEDNKLIVHKGPEKKDTFISKITKKVHAVSSLKKYTYKAKWTVHDTHIKEYNTTFFALDEKDRQNDLTIAWFDPCQWGDDNSNGTPDLNSSCNISGNAGGYDGASYEIPSGTITLDGGKLLFNSGTSIFLNGGGITLSGGSIEEGNLCQLDADSDNYKASITQKDCSSVGTDYRRSSDLRSGSGVEHWVSNLDCNDDPTGGGQNVQQNYGNYVYDSDNDGYSGNSAQSYCLSTSTSGSYRKNTSGNYDYIVSTSLSGTSDCAPSDGSKWQNLAGYIDSDGDGYGTGGGGDVCSGSSLPNGYADNNNDCKDDDSDVNPGISADTCKSDKFGIGGSPEGDGYHDNDCDGQTDEDSQCYCHDDDDNDGAFGGGPYWECVSNSSSSGSDCDDNDASIVDANDGSCDGDGDGYTDGTAGGSDCNDDPASGGEYIYRNISNLAPDVDHDGYAGGSATTECVGAHWQSPAGRDYYRYYTGNFDEIEDTDIIGSDCNDNDGTKYQNLCGYTDSDGDGYGTGTQNCSICSGSSLPNGYADNSNDCMDSESSVNPGAGYHNYDGPNNGDWDCNGSVDYQVDAMAVSDCVEIDGTWNARVSDTEYKGTNCAAMFRTDSYGVPSFTGTIDTDSDGNGCDQNYLYDNCSSLSLDSRSAYRK